jgi:hypothetical protein
VNKTLGWVTLAAAVTAAVALAVGAYLLAGFAWDEVAEYRSPFVANELPPSSAGPVLSDRVVLVIVDGLTEEASRGMASFESLREYGASLTAVTGQPSLSYPGWTTLLTGAPQHVSGVTTNWWEGMVEAETLIDTALAARRGVVVVGPDSLEELYGAERADGVFLKDWYDEGDEGYRTGELVLATIDLVEMHDPGLVIVHLPDLDDAGHAAGAASDEYAETAARIDADLLGLVDAVQDGATTFVLTSDHGHIASGGHGGWEDEVVRTPLVISGGEVAFVSGEVDQADVAPTVAVLAGVPVPRHSLGEALPSVVASANPEVVEAARVQRATFVASYAETLGEDAPSVVELAQMDGDAMAETIAEVQESRIAADRGSRIWLGLVAAVLAAVVLVAIGLISWRALVAAGAGALAYYVVYNALFFLVHGYAWSLSAFNDEALLESFFNVRLAEAALSGMVAAAVAGIVYPYLRKEPKGARGVYLPRWLALGAMTVLVVQATLLLQVAWFVWWYGVEVTWILPDLMWGFKFDLDLIQMTALGAAAVLAPLLTWLAGRYHPRVRAAATTAAAAGTATSVSTPADTDEEA